MSDGQITICDEQPEPSDGKIVICDEKPEPSEGKIVICPPKCGPDVPALTISGTETPAVGSLYGGSGGKPPYLFSISAGAINLTTGQVTSLSGACGAGTVTVRDACGQSASMDVRFPSGQWVFEEDEWGNPCNVSKTNSCTNYSGKYRWVNSWENIARNYPQQIGCAGCYSGGNVLLENPCTKAALPYKCQSGGRDEASVKHARLRYVWACP